MQELDVDQVRSGELLAVGTEPLAQATGATTAEDRLEGGRGVDDEQRAPSVPVAPGAHGGDERTRRHGAGPPLGPF